MRAKTIAAVLAGAALAILCLPTGALARGGAANGPAHRGEGADTTSLTQELKLRGSNGYSIKVTLSDRRELLLDATSLGFKPKTFSVVSYALSAPQKAGSDDIKARIGNFGRIDLRFVPERTKKGKPLCKGDELVTETGHYVGSFSFHGAGGFTEANAHRVEGTVGRETTKRCPSTKQGVVFGKATTKRSEKETSELLGEEGNEGQLTAELGGADFTATKSTLKFRQKEIVDTNFFAVGVRKQGRITIASVIEQYETKGKAFELPDPEEPAGEAIVSPRSPFSGSATFRRGSPTASQWTGNLKVALPGIGVLPLTGPGANVTLCTSACSEGLFSTPIAASDPTVR